MRQRSALMNMSKKQIKLISTCPDASCAEAENKKMKKKK